MSGHYLNQCCFTVHWTIGIKFHWHLTRNIVMFMHENEFDYVICKIMTIFFQLQCVRWFNWPILVNMSHSPARGIKNNAWVTVNNDFGSRVRRFANHFHEWRSHKWKWLVNRITSDPKIVIHGNECIILFLTRYLMSWTHNSAKTIIGRWFRHCC